LVVPRSIPIIFAIVKNLRVQPLILNDSAMDRQCEKLAETLGK
jgi:hypothetical protein